MASETPLSQTSEDVQASRNGLTTTVEIVLFNQKANPPQERTEVEHYRGGPLLTTRTTYEYTLLIRSIEQLVVAQASQHKQPASRDACTIRTFLMSTYTLLHSHHPTPIGHEITAKICMNFVTHLFACPELPPISTTNPTAPSPRLDLFITHALHRTRLHPSVTFAALYLLRRLKARFPAACGSSGHRLFISAFMLASKVICDDTYLNKSWSIVGQEPTSLKEFEERVKRDFKGPGPYPSYLMPSPAPSPMPSTTPYAPSAPTPAPSFVTGRSAPSSSPPKPSVRTTAPESTYVSSPGSPSMPDTPEASHSASTSPASSVSPPTPQGQVDNEVRIVSPDGIQITVDHHHHVPVPKPSRSQTHPQPSSRMSKDSALSSRKPKCDLFAYAALVAW
ncbi:hypothetical protein BDY19DRAFT_998106 [Irpex rosettiformis]|uniref:Uncharacterized protein n=1 Tax=Irpex rosettiformis TaxID=378272 RepID=A0ACB8TPR9_9APHY|nr:hypothetical protein BDY19DRAFT_998106 [Irpex rosettiformis]